ncbi:MAG: glycosyltransferase family 39 protein [Cyanobacteria bacterium SID2]|nr:glycosyltransferase family 39 protein [Cyanobacteria bacterium SID2]
MIRRNPWIVYLSLSVLTIILLCLTCPTALKLRWNDETLYYTVARNIFEEFNFYSNHYLSESLIQVGYPTKDTHLPGYPLILSLGFGLFGVSEKTPFLVNYILSVVTVFAIYRTGEIVASRKVGIIASLIYLFYPTTLILTHSAMTETAASAVIAIIGLLFVSMRNGIPKGLLLAASIGLAYLIKPFLLIFLPVILVSFLIFRSSKRVSTSLSLLSMFGFLFVTIFHAFLQNREFYPYEATTILATPGLFDKLNLMFANIGHNCQRLFFMPWRSGEKLTTLYLSGLWAIAIGVFFKIKSNHCYSKAVRLLTIASLSFLGVLVAIFTLYNYSAWRGTRALSFVVPLLAVVVAIGLDRIYPKLFRVQTTKFQRISIWLTWVVLLFLLLLSNRATFNQLRTSQIRQYSALQTANARLERIVETHKLQPRVVMSSGNFYYAVDRYPTQVIWTLPHSLDDLKAIKNRVSVDLIELRSNSNLFRENQHKYGTIEALDGTHQLIDRQDDFYYYVRTP